MITHIFTATARNASDVTGGSLLGLAGVYEKRQQWPEAQRAALKVRIWCGGHWFLCWLKK